MYRVNDAHRSIDDVEDLWHSVVMVVLIAFRVIVWKSIIYIFVCFGELITISLLLEPISFSQYFLAVNNFITSLDCTFIYCLFFVYYFRLISIVLVISVKH